MIRKSSKEKSNDKNSPTQDKTDDFLLAEFRESAEALRFTDTRLQTAINFYLSVFAASAPVLAVLYYYLGDKKFNVFIGITIIVDCCLVALGFVAIQIVTNSDFLKAEYILSLQLIRRYFADKNPAMLPYLYFPVANQIVDKDKPRNQVKPSFNTTIAIGINSINSILMGWIIAGSTWLVTQILFSQAFLIGFAVAVICFIVFHAMYKRKIKRLSNARD